MGEGNEGQDYSQPAYVDPKLGDSPPVGAVIDKDPVCRKCMTVSEEITMRRGFVDPISAAEAGEKGIACARCGGSLLGAS